MALFHPISILFWISIFIVVYTYVGYGILLYIINKLFKNSSKTPADHFFPEVTLVIAAYNEEDFIEQKIKNSLDMEYPAEKLSILMITDGSTDRTPELVQKYSRITLLHREERKGKTAALNRAMQFVKTPIVIFTDANTLLNKDALKNIVRHYYNPKVGGVAGEKKIINGKEAAAAEAGEGIYWKYESFLKKQDSNFYTVVGAAGELFSVRTQLFQEVEENVLLDDFIISMRVCKKGYVVKYEPEAYAVETASASIKEEQKRKVRISAGGIQSIIMLKALLNPFKYPKLSFQYLSHRILRWAVCPILLPLIFITNAILAFIYPQPLYIGLFILQCIFYAAATTGWIFASRNIKIKLLYVPYYFVFMNAAVYMGFSRFMNNKQSVLWDKAARKKAA